MPDLLRVFYNFLIVLLFLILKSSISLILLNIQIDYKNKKNKYFVKACLG